MNKMRLRVPKPNVILTAMKIKDLIKLQASIDPLIDDL